MMIRSSRHIHHDFYRRNEREFREIILFEGCGVLFVSRDWIAY